MSSLIMFSGVRDQKRKGHNKPHILYDAFFNGSKTAFEDMAEKAGLARQDNDPRKMPNFVYNAIKKQRKAQQTAQSGEDNERLDGLTQADVDAFMMKSIEKHGRVKFASRNNIAEFKMYQAILAGQKYASLHGTREADFVKDFRREPGSLLISCTGAIGSIEEDEAQLPRYARGESLLDYDEEVRPTAYTLDPETVPRVLWVSQTASMGENAKSTQNRLTKDIVKNRGDTVIQSIQDGLISHNPGQYHDRIMQYWHDKGWKPRFDAAANEIRVHNLTSHLHGHGFARDLQHTINNLKAISHEFIHIPGWRNFHDGRNMVKRAGKRTLIDMPQNWVNNVLHYDEETGEPVMKQRDHLSIRRWLFTLKRPHRQPYGGSLKAYLDILRRSAGTQRDEGLDVRTRDNGAFKDQTAHTPVQAFQRSATGTDARQRKLAGPSTTDVKQDGRPRRRNVAVHIARRQQLLKRAA